MFLGWLVKVSDKVFIEVCCRPQSSFRTASVSLGWGYFGLTERQNLFEGNVQEAMMVNLQSCKARNVRVVFWISTPCTWGSGHKRLQIAARGEAATA